MGSAALKYYDAALKCVRESSKYTLVCVQVMITMRNHCTNLYFRLREYRSGYVSWGKRFDVQIERPRVNQVKEALGKLSETKKEVKGIFQNKDLQNL